MRKNDDLTAWRIFIRVIETASITKTATEWNVEPSSISRRISALEQSLGVQLLLRTTRQLAPTNAGLRAYEHIRPLMEQFDAMAGHLSNDSAHLSGKIRFSAPVALGEFLLVPWLAEFMALYPEIEIELDLVNQTVDLLGTAIDVALRIGALIDDKVIATPLGFIPSIACASPAYLAQHDAPSHPDDLAQHRLVLYSGLAARGFIHLSKNDEVAQVPYHGALKINNLTALSQAAKSGMGIHLLAPLFQCLPDIDNGQLVQVLPDWQFAHAPVHIVRLPKRNTPQRIMVLIEFIQQKWQTTKGVLPVK